MSQEFLDYPKARVALGAGDLQDAFDVSGVTEDGEKIVATLRRNPAGSTGGTRSGTATFKSAISQDGFERDWFGMYRKRKVVQLRIKAPGVTWVFTGRLTKPQITSNVDNYIEFTISVIGKFDVAPV